MSFIYIHKNYKDNYKIYIGQSIQSNVKQRWKNGQGYLRKKKDDSEQGWHYTQPRMAEAVLNSDWNKDWDHDILEDLGDCTQKELDDREAYWISFFDSANPLHGYNIMKKSKGQGAMSEDTKRKISKANKGKPHAPMSEETKKKISESMKGIIHSEESIRKTAEAQKGKYVSEETRKKLSESHLGKSNGPHSEETKKKISESNKGKMVSEETKKKLSETQKGKSRPHEGHPQSEETRKKISESWKRRKNL